MIKLQWSCYLCSNKIGTVPLSLKAADSSPGPIGNKQTESLAHLPLFVSVYLSYLSWRHRVKSPPLTFPLEWPSPVPATPHWTERALTPIRTTLREREAASGSRNNHNLLQAIMTSLDHAEVSELRQHSRKPRIHQDCLIKCTSCSLAQNFLYLNIKLESIPWRWTWDQWTPLPILPSVATSNKSPFSAFPNYLSL